jgi:hypothetical protein
MPDSTGHTWCSQTMMQVGKVCLKYTLLTKVYLLCKMCRDSKGREPL